MKWLAAALVVVALLSGCATTKADEDVYSLLQKGNDAYAKGNYAKAIKYYEAFLSQENDQGIEEKLIATMWLTKDYNGIIKATKKYVESGSGETGRMFDFANAAYRLGAKEKAIEAYSRILAPQAYSFEGLFAYAQGKEEDGELGLALQAYEACIGINPEDVMSHNNKAYVLYNMNGDMDAASEEIEYVIQRLSDDPWCRRMAGNIWYRKGDYKKALEYYTKALALYNDKNEYGDNGKKVGKIELLLGIARADMRLGKNDEAKKAYRDAIALGSKEAEAEMKTIK